MLWVLDALRAFLWLPSPFLSLSFSLLSLPEVGSELPASPAMAFTKKQQAALSRARGPPEREALKASFMKQQNLSKKSSKAENLSSAGFKSRPGKSFDAPRARGPSLKVWDAEHNSHMPLPRSTGPYTVTRITTRYTVDRDVNIFGTFRRRDTASGALGEWSSVFCVSDVTASQPVNAANNATFTGHNMAGYGYETTVAPSAFSVQVCNPAALQTTTGMTYLGVCSSQLGISNSPEPWNDWAERFITNMRPRSMSASSIAVRGKKVCSYPLSLESLCDFTEITTTVSSTGTWSGAVMECSGFAPIVLYNPGGATLEVLVTTEWRTRFSLSHPAASSHKMWLPTPERIWHASLNAAAAVGNGVVDVAEGVEKVAAAGHKAAKAVGFC